jgi:hypothetical protein
MNAAELPVPDHPRFKSGIKTDFPNQEFMALR